MWFLICMDLTNQIFLWDLSMKQLYESSSKLFERIERSETIQGQFKLNSLDLSSAVDDSR